MDLLTNIFEYQYLANAVIACLLSSITCGIVGTYIVARRMVFLCGGITHASFGGLGIAFYLGANPILGAFVAAVLSALGIEAMSHNTRIREDSAIGIIWSVGMALGARLFEYFCYRSYEHEFFGILDPDGNDRIYDIVKTAGDRVAYLEPIVSQYDSLGGYMVPGSRYSFNTAAMIMAKDLFCEPFALSVHGEYDTLVGCFTGEKGKGYLLVNYTDPIRKCNSTVTLSAHGIPAIKLYKDGKETLLQAKDGKFTVTLEYGNSAFVVW